MPIFLVLGFQIRRSQKFIAKELSELIHILCFFPMEIILAQKWKGERDIYIYIYTVSYTHDPTVTLYIIKQTI